MKNIFFQSHNLKISLFSGFEIFNKSSKMISGAVDLPSYKEEEKQTIFILGNDQSEVSSFLNTEEIKKMTQFLPSFY
jgi:hypothetical protein